jgi:hypothetical protein
MALYAFNTLPDFDNLLKGVVLFLSSLVGVLTSIVYSKSESIKICFIYECGHTLFLLISYYSLVAAFKLGKVSKKEFLL